MKAQGEILSRGDSPLAPILANLQNYASEFPVGRSDIRALAWGPMAEARDNARQRKYLNYLGSYANSLIDLEEKTVTGILVEQARREMEFSRTQEFRYLKRVDAVLERAEGEMLDDDIEVPDEDLPVDGGLDPILRAVMRQYRGTASIVDDAYVLGEYPELLAIQTMSCQYPYHMGALALAENDRHTNMDILEATGFKVTRIKGRDRSIKGVYGHMTDQHIYPGSYARVLDATIELPENLPITTRSRRLQLVSRLGFTVLPGEIAQLSSAINSTQYLRVHPDDRDSDDRDSEPSQYLIL